MAKIRWRLNEDGSITILNVPVQTDNGITRKTMHLTADEVRERRESKKRAALNDSRQV